MTTKEKILETAAEAFAQHGFEGVRIDALAKQAGVNKATFYYHYKSKQHIFEKVMQNSFNALVQKIDARLSEYSAPEDKITCFIDLMFSRQRRDVLLIIREVISGGENLTDELLLTVSEIQERLHEILKEGKSQKVFKSDDPSIAFHLIVGMADFYIIGKPVRKKCNEHFELDEVHFINTITTLVIDTLKRG
jgi:AcrR family transcriptional regulator